MRLLSKKRDPGTSRLHQVVGDVEMDLIDRRVYVKGQRVHLTLREWTLLQLLALDPGRLVSKQRLAEAVLGAETAACSNSVEVHVSSLRRKLGRDVIETVRGLGYRIVD
jgi:two-component system OmpR family response regulator